MTDRNTFRPLETILKDSIPAPNFVTVNITGPELFEAVFNEVRLKFTPYKKFRRAKITSIIPIPK